MDGHDKLAAYGISIYAAIDAHSRKILWVYVGPANRVKVSILMQYLRAVLALGRCPRRIRTDRGGETVLMAEAQYSLYSAHKQAEGWTSTQIKQIQLRDCYWYGSSPANQRIESFWLRLIISQTNPWMVCCQNLGRQPC